MLRRGRSVRPVTTPGAQPPTNVTIGAVVTPNDLNAMIAMATGGPMPRSNERSEVVRSEPLQVSSSASSAVPARLSSNMSLPQIAAVVQQWQQILGEVTQAVFVIVGDVLVPQLPLYMELPNTKNDLANPVMHAQGTVTLLYPQYTREDYIYMRIRVVDPNTAEVQQYYAPVGPTNERSLLQGTYYPVYVGRFRNPGEPIPDTGVSYSASQE